MKGLNHQQLAQRIARDIPDGAYVNLGIGLPTMIADYLPAEKEIFLHSENGILGMGPSPAEDSIDPELINAGKQPVTLLPGGCFFHHGDSFAMMRGGHLDICVLGAYQVSEQGDLANWSTGEAEAIPAVGGAMDLAIGAKKAWVMTTHLTKKGQCKLVEACSYPLTGMQCIDRIYTDMAVMDITPAGVVVIELLGDITADYLQEITPIALQFALAEEEVTHV